MKNRKKAKGKVYILVSTSGMGCSGCAASDDSNLCVALGKKCQAEEHRYKIWKEEPKKVST